MTDLPEAVRSELLRRQGPAVSANDGGCTCPLDGTRVATCGVLGHAALARAGAPQPSAEAVAAGTRVALALTGADRLDPSRPTVGQLVAAEVTLAERRAAAAVAQAALDRAALLDVLGAVAGYARGDRELSEVLDAAARAQRHLDRTGGAR